VTIPLYARIAGQATEEQSQCQQECDDDASQLKWYSHARIVLSEHNCKSHMASQLCQYDQTAEEEHLPDEPGAFVSQTDGFPACAFISDFTVAATGVNQQAFGTSSD
jgi:hypothetical protein